MISTGSLCTALPGFITQIRQHKYRWRIPIYGNLVKRIAGGIIRITLHWGRLLRYYVFCKPVRPVPVGAARHHTGNTFLYSVSKSRTKMGIVTSEFPYSRNIAYAKCVLTEKIIYIIPKGVVRSTGGVCSKYFLFIFLFIRFTPFFYK